MEQVQVELRSAAVDFSVHLYIRPPGRVSEPPSRCSESESPILTFKFTTTSSIAHTFSAFSAGPVAPSLNCWSCWQCPPGRPSIGSRLGCPFGGSRLRGPAIAYEPESLMGSVLQLAVTPPTSPAPSPLPAPFRAGRSPRPVVLPKPERQPEAAPPPPQWQGPEAGGRDPLRVVAHAGPGGRSLRSACEAGATCMHPTT